MATNNATVEAPHTAQYLHRLFDNDFEKFMAATGLQRGWALRKWGHPYRTRRDSINLSEVWWISDALEIDVFEVWGGFREAMASDGLLIRA